MEAPKRSLGWEPFWDGCRINEMGPKRRVSLQEELLRNTHPIGHLKNYCPLCPLYETGVRGTHKTCAHYMGGLAVLTNFGGQQKLKDTEMRRL